MFDFDDLEENDPVEPDPDPPAESEPKVDDPVEHPTGGGYPSAKLGAEAKTTPSVGNTNGSVLLGSENDVGQDFEEDPDDSAGGPILEEPGDISMAGQGALDEEPLSPSNSTVQQPESGNSASPESEGKLAVGAKVEIKGLKSRADLNGRKGEISQHDTAVGRFEILIDGPQGEKVRCKPENITLLKAAPDSPAKQQGDQAFKSGQYEVAIECYMRALRDDAKDHAELAATLHSNLSAAYAKRSNHQKALQEADNAIRLRPEWAKGHSRKALSLLNLGRDSEAQSSYIKAVKFDPVNDGYLAGLRQATEKLSKSLNAQIKTKEADEKKDLGNKALKEGNISMAIAHYTTALALQFPTATASENTKQQVAIFYSNRSAAFAKLLQWQFALADAREATKMSPKWSKAHVREAMALAGQWHTEHAYKKYLYAINLQAGYQEAIQGMQQCLGNMPMYKSPLMQRRIKRFSEDANKPKGFCRVFAIGDVHIDHGASVMRWAEGLSMTEFRNDCLIVAGDLGDTLNAIKRGLGIFKKRFRRVFYTPGNHDMWIRPNTTDSKDNKFGDSIGKLLAMFDVCEQLGCEMFPAEVMQGVYVVPLLSWHSCTFDVGDPRPGDQIFDSFCKWPMGEDEVWAYMLRWNNYFIDRIRYAQKERGTPGEVITFSHFLPVFDIMTFNAPVKASGCLALEKQVVEVGSNIHVFGHTHLNMQNEVRGHLYAQHSLMGPEYGLYEKQSFLVCHENGRICQAPLKTHKVY
eukprot:gnl/MRDRNA2_/MRDRNA2_174654_c0_seq1.p1 gnl/MRDRNA2_/MRDRNA2_174654_c0~~gnl/MRDRNA2_/MRDRNA2_174654_c0_seq1.p1  ORF type:complete len:750 (+),score=145.63 gnl/MRDRNA2_/MRDRNA2_174654_c0_seq1:62-2311(+)